MEEDWRWFVVVVVDVRCCSLKVGRCGGGVFLVLMMAGREGANGCERANRDAQPRAVTSSACPSRFRGQPLQLALFHERTQTRVRHQ